MFSRLTQKFKMPAKSGGKTFFCKKSPVDTLWVKNFVEIALSHSVSAINTFVCFTQIQDGRQKWWENDFLGKVASRRCRYPVGQKFCQNRSIPLCFRDKRVLAFYAEIQDVHQKWREKDFWEKSPVYFRDTLWVKNFVEIALSHSISEVNVFLRLMQKFKMAAKSGGKTFFCKKLPVDSADTQWVKNFVEIALSHSVSEINTFFCFTQIQDGRQKWRENNLGGKVASRLQIPCGSKISLKLLYLAPFLR